MKMKKMELPDGWYPKDKASCEKEIQQYLNDYNKKNLNGNWVGAIVPHAGWFFSGKVACQTIHLLSLSIQPDVIVIFGGHLGKHDLPTYYDYDVFETPFGNINRHKVLFDNISNTLKGQLKPDRSVDNTVEIQLPFIKYFFPNVEILAFRSPPSERAINLGQIIGEKGKELGLKLAFIGSIDLTHYGPNYGFMPKGSGEEGLTWMKEVNDKEFIYHLLKMEGQDAIDHAIKNQSSCSSGGAVACMSASQIYGSTTGQLVDYYTSYDIMKNSSFVGYVGMLY